VAGYFVVGTLAAFGGLCLLWTILGWLLPSGKGCALVCYGAPDEGIYARYRWLRSMGFLSCPLLAVSEEEIGCWKEAELCTTEALLARLEGERIYGTGTGDPAGRGKRSGISEL